MSDSIVETGNPVQASRAMAEAIAETEEYRAFEKARENLASDSQARKLLDELEASEQKAQLANSWGGLSEHDRKKLERMRDEVFKQPTIKAFLEAQQSFITELQELNCYTTERLGLDFADLAKPQTGCCG